MNEREEGHAEGRVLGEAEGNATGRVAGRIAAREEQLAVIRRWGPGLARAISALTVIFAIVFVVLWNEQQHTLDELSRRAMLGCHRSNVERAQANKANFADYNFFTLVLRLSPKPKPSQEPEPRRARTKHVLRSFREDIDAKSFTPLSPCIAGSHIYQPPAAISFTSVHGKPPHSAFYLQKGQ